MKTIFKGILPKIILAIILGLSLGLIAPEVVVRFFATINGIFSNFLGFVIPLIIVGLIVSSISDLGKSAGKLLLFTVGIAYLSTLFSGFLTFFSAKAIYPIIIGSQQSAANLVDTTIDMSLKPFFEIGMPPILDVMSALLLSFLIGIGISTTEGNTLKKIFEEFKIIIEKVIANVIIPFLPIYIFGVFLNMSFTGEAYNVIITFGKVIVFIISMSVMLLILQYSGAAMLVGANPFKLLRIMLPAYVTALGTSSSAATIPVTLAQVKKMGVSEHIAEFCVPLCATIHLAGSAMKITGMSMAILWINGASIDLTTYIGFIFMMGITMVAAPGVPGGAIMAALAILQTILGFNQQDCALMIAVYIAIDSFGTACNVVGDGAVSILINKISGERLSVGVSRHIN